MSHQKLPVLILLTILMGVHMDIKAQAGMTDDAWQEVQNFYEQKMAGYEVVGGAMLFLENGDVQNSIFKGFANLELKQEINEDTIFHWASITKTLTAVAVMQLRDRGEIALDEPLIKYLPEISSIHNPFGEMDEITIRMALSHSTGLRNSTWPWGGNEDWHPFEPTKWDQLVAMFPYTEVNFKPGTQHSYSNPAIIFLGKIIEQVTGDPYEVYVDKNILKPLGMDHSYFNHTPYHLLGKRSNSYVIRNDQPQSRGLDFHTGITTSNGGLNASLADMVKYLNFLAGVEEKKNSFEVLKRSSINELWQAELPIDEEDGVTSVAALSFFIEEFDGMRVVGHTGTQWSYYSFFYIHPESGTAVISVTNSDGKHNMHKFRDEVSHYLFKEYFTRYKQQN